MITINCEINNYLPIKRFQPDFPSFFINSIPEIAKTNIISEIIVFIKIEESKLKSNKSTSKIVLVKIQPNVIHTQITFFVDIIENKHTA